MRVAFDAAEGAAAREGSSSPGRRDVRIAWRYRHPTLPMLVVLAIGCVASVVSMSLFGARQVPIVLTLLVDVAFAIGFVVSGYLVLASAVGWRWFDLHGDTLRYGVLPLPLPRSRARYDATKIRDVFVRRVATTLTRTGAERSIRPTFDVVLFTGDENHHATSFADVESALRCASALHEALRLEDGPSPELARWVGDLRRVLTRELDQAAVKLAAAAEAGRRKPKSAS